jgi:hypothetical protein
MFYFLGTMTLLSPLSCIRAPEMSINYGHGCRRKMRRKRIGLPVSMGKTHTHTYHILENKVGCVPREQVSRDPKGGKSMGCWSGVQFAPMSQLPSRKNSGLRTWEVGMNRGIYKDIEPGTTDITGITHHYHYCQVQRPRNPGKGISPQDQPRTGTKGLVLRPVPQPP